jgi:hypothetical protein
MIVERHPVPTGLVTKQEKIAGWIYFPVHLLLMPVVLSLLTLAIPDVFSDAGINAVYMGTGFLYIILFLRQFLRRIFDTLLDGKFRVFIL